jgi:hypothetical protein
MGAFAANEIASFLRCQASRPIASEVLRSLHYQAVKVPEVHSPFFNIPFCILRCCSNSQGLVQPVLILRHQCCEVPLINILMFSSGWSSALQSLIGITYHYGAV